VSTPAGSDLKLTGFDQGWVVPAERGHCLGSWLAGWGEGHVVAEGFELADEVAFACFGVVAAGEVVAAEVVVVGVVGQ